METERSSKSISTNCSINQTHRLIKTATSSSFLNHSKALNIKTDHTTTKQRNGAK